MNEHLNVPSPIATGGAGPTFEQHVGAMFLALLLIRGVPAILRDWQVDEVSFQTRHLGWRQTTFCCCSTENDQRRRLAMQVKRNFTVGYSSPDCVQTFQRFWKDFKATELFDPGHDVLALATLPGSKALMGGLGSLLECARNSSDAGDFPPQARYAWPHILSSEEARRGHQVHLERDRLVASDNG